ncbi:inorganic pyrophosphatase [Ascoidea rubescens DSM 1968]|uniref:inorganic diphosphatase n=1 Tax=Ascoidea rubescens DSM 1968 TaxID=1344418 RepID=A0A1D2VH94_9ASCO|nr:inorganic pyrophosphatase [Ascoidea rubescens DSM 1968]ODV61024.1 inorganic pyrophosphatase [Ascoidea rubescens DSM 1968]
MTSRHLSSSSSLLNTGASGGSEDAFNYSIIKEGSKFTEDYKVYCYDKSADRVLSYFHDVPINFNTAQKTVNMILEIPFLTNAKFEINKKLKFNPITQDIKNDKVRFIHNLFPFHGYVSNYGSIPQTWEDPIHFEEIEKDLRLQGDNDPLDIVDISVGNTLNSEKDVGDIYKVKVLGALALIDDGEIDWKIISINCNDPLSKHLSDINDINKIMPNYLNHLKNWFKNYKKPMNKPENKFAFNGEYLNSDKAIEIISKCYSNWQQLISSKYSNAELNISPKIIAKLPTVSNSTLKDTAGFESIASKKQTVKEAKLPESAIPSEVNKYYFVD